jgi:hypothetical protein
MTMWDSLLPSLVTLAGLGVATNANTQAANNATAATLQGAQIGADATLKGAQISSDAALKGAEITASAARDAAATQSDAIMKAAQYQAAALVKASDEVRSGYEKSFQILDTMRKDTQAGTDYLKGVVSEPGELTPAQQTQLEDLRRSVDSQIRGSQFAGSGRSAAALMKKTETDFVNQALENNRNRAMTAATTLNAGNSTATSELASGQRGLAGRIADLTQASGKNQADAIAAFGKATAEGINTAGQATGAGVFNAGQIAGSGYAKAGQITGDAYGKAGTIDANAGIANASLTGQAIGNIGSQIAAERRASKYGDRMAKIEKSLGIG